VGAPKGVSLLVGGRGFVARETGVVHAVPEVAVIVVSVRVRAPQGAVSGAGAGETSEAYGR
jgi:hypothetical protein